MKIAESGVTSKLALSLPRPRSWLGLSDVLQRFAKQAATMLLLLAALPFAAHAVVAQLGTAATYFGPGPTSATLANFVVPAGSDRLLVVTASSSAYQNTSAVNYGATPMTKVVEKNDGSFASDSIWVLPLGTGAALSASSISATFINNVNPANPAIEAYLSAVVFSGVNQFTPINNAVSTNNPMGTNLPSTLNVTSVVGDLVYDVLDSFSHADITNVANSGQTLVASNGGALTSVLANSDFGRYSNSSKPGGPSVVMAWTSNADANIQAAINIRQAPAAPDLTITKTVVGAGPFYRGGQLTYRIQVNNVGTGPTSGNWTISDAAPIGISFASVSVNVGNTSGCTGNTTSISCTQSTVIPPGGNVVFSILSNVAANAPASVTNTANASGGGETTTNNNAGSVTINPVDPADLTLSKTAVGTFQQGGTASYTVTVTNTGAGPTTLSYTVTDTMPTGLTAGVVTSPDAGWNCTSSTSTLVSCTRTTALAAGASTMLNIPVTIASNAPASITNTATVTGGGELVTNNNAGSSVVSVTQLAPDLTITKVAQGSPFQQGGTVSYVITVTNGGNGPTTGTVTVQDVMPTGLTATSASGTNWTCFIGATVTCTATSAIAAGASTTFTIIANISPTAPATITNTATVATPGESNSGNNGATSIISVTQVSPDLTITKVAQGAPFQQGGTVSYVITVTNGGNGPTTGTVTVQDIIPTGLTVTSASGANWSCVPGATVSCSAISAIAAGASSAFTINANIAANAPASITNSAAVATAGESNSGNNGATSVISVTQVAPDLTITKVAQGGPFQQGGTVSYLITVTNGGNGPTTGTVTVQDIIPTGLTVTSASGANWSCVPGATVSCSAISAIAAGASSAFTINANIAANAPASITNSAAVATAGESNSGNNGATSVISVTQVAPDLTITKVAQGGPFQQGGTVSYLITVTNGGNGPTTGTVTVQDIIPTGLTVTSASGANWSCVPGATVSCTAISAIAAGASSAFTINANIAANAPASITNSAAVATAGESNSGNNGTTSVISVTQVAPDLTITKVAQGGPFQQGGTVSYLITVTNGGNGPTTGSVTVQDIIPPGLTVTSASGANWTCSTGAAVTCTAISAIAAGASSAFTINANIAANAPASITNSAGVATVGESNSGNNGATSVISVTATTNVTITVPAGISYSFNGQNVTGPQTFAVAPGTYTLSTTTPQSLGAGSRAVFANWSDAGAIAHSVTVGSSALTITGNYTTQFQLTTAASPVNGGTVTPASGTFFDSGTVVNLSATANAGFVFSSWTGPVASASSAATTVTMDAAKSVTANFIAQTNVTINVPTGISYTFNGQTVTSTQTFQVAPGTYTLATTTPQSLGAGVRGVFASWSDAGAISHSVTVGATAVTITGSFTTQYQLTTAASPANGGTVTPASGTFYDSGTVVNVSATANAGFVFGSWTGPVASASSAATTVTMDAAKSVTANFIAQTNVTINVPTGISYTFNGQTVTGTQTFPVVPGTYTLATTTPQSLGAGTRGVFANWSDAGAISHSVTVGATAMTITGSFTTQYQLTTAAAPTIGGTVTPATGTFYDTGTVVNVSATANAGFTFGNWTGPVASANAAATTVTMDAAKSITANFTAVRTFSGTTATGSGVASVVMTTVDGGATCGLTTASWVPVTTVPQPAPSALLFPHGLFDFQAKNCANGSTITFTITYPPTTAPLAAYWKFGPTASNTTAHWYNIPSTINGNTVTFSITDGGLGDDDMNADGTIIDQGGPVTLAPPIPTPTVNLWLLALMMLSVFGYGLRRTARERASSR